MSFKQPISTAMSTNSETSCPSCGTELQQVENRECEFSGQQFACVMCCTRYVFEESAPAQTFSRTDERVSNCITCGKSFNQASSLKRHMMVHTAERPFPCTDCDKSFKTKAALKRHTIIHTGECPYECSTCKRKFNQISNLRKHLLIHSNNCPYFCSMCGKGFNQLSNLKKHLAVHQDRNVHGNKKLTKQQNSHLSGPKSIAKEGKRPSITFVRPAPS